MQFKESSRPTLNLALSRSARAFHPEESLWEIELGKIYRLLRQHLDVLETERAPSLEHRAEDRSPGVVALEALPLLSIAIFGTYGSGKTSLLKTLIRETNSDQKHPRLDKPRPDEVYALPLIAPNLLAHDDHFLYAFLASALEEDLRKQGRQERLASGSYQLSPVQQAFHKVSEYLQVIDPKKTGQESDPLGRSLERLDRHSSSFLLRNELQRFISVLADELTGTPRESIVLLSVDDGDMSLQNLIRLLDTYRRYLRHPRLVPVFTFTSKLAEELLEVHFAQKLDTERSQRMAERRRERTTTSLNMTEHLAYQYLVKLFPIRNRIRLGPAPARVQAGTFIDPLRKVDSEQTSKSEVMELLESSSSLLFGHPEWPLVPKVRLALRPSTLRRQLQVLDAMHDAGVGNIPSTDKDSQEESATGRDTDGGPANGLTWVQVFDKAAWSLLNVHGDVLREVGLNIEDLYSWTPQGLRDAVLSALLSLDRATRRTIIKRWRYSVESRRAQILSLLAMVTFRPEMEGEEPSGDEPDRIGLRPREVPTEPRWEFSAYQGLVWFLSLWIGFYLPQIVGRRRERLASARSTGSQRVVGTAWDLQSGPIHASREARKTGQAFATGMMRLDPGEWAGVFNPLVEDIAEEEKLIEEESSGGHAVEKNDDVESTAENGDRDQGLKPEVIDKARKLLVAHIWCFYGYAEREAWVLLSLWRGLGLVGQVLVDYEKYRLAESVNPDHEQAAGKNRKANPKERLHQRIQALILSHCSSTRRPGMFSEEGKGGAATTFHDLNLKSKYVQKAAEELADEIVHWLQDYEKRHLDPLLGNVRDDSWQQSFMRRLHGDHLVGRFWPLLGGAYLAPLSPGERIKQRKLRKNNPWNAERALRDWLRAVLDYFDPVMTDQEPTTETNLSTKKNSRSEEKINLLEQCPLLRTWSGAKEKATKGKEQEKEAPSKKLQELFRSIPVWSEPKEQNVNRVLLEKTEGFELAVSNSGSEPFKVDVQGKSKK